MSKKKPLDSMRLIRRDSNGCVLKFQIPGSKKPDGSARYHVSFFGYTHYGNREAVKLAKSLRDKLEEAYGLRKLHWNEIRGVSLQIREIPYRIQLHCCWRASWRQTVEGVRVSRSRSFCFKPDDSFSRSAAWHKAVTLRAKMEWLHYQ